MDADDVEVVGARQINLSPGESAVVYSAVNVLLGTAANHWPAADNTVRDRVTGTAKHSDAPLEMQSVGGVTDGKHLWFRPGSGDAWVEVSFQSGQEQDVDLTLKMVHSWDYGIYRVKLDGQQIAQLDLYSPDVKPTTDKLGRHHLDAGTHTLRFECLGKSPESKGYFLGFDALAVRIPAYSRLASVDLRTLQKTKD